MSITNAFVRAAVLAFCGICLLSTSAGALIEVGGDEPVTDRGWPTGAREVVNLPTRVSYWVGPPFGGGQFCFQYRCEDTQAFNEALEAFSRIVAPRLELIVLDGMTTPGEGLGASAHWEFLAWVPADFYGWGRQGGARPRVGTYCALPVPTLTVYLGEGNPIRWEDVKVPANIQVIDKRVETSAYKDSTGGVIEMHVYDMGTGAAVAGVAVSLSQPRGNGAGSTYHAETDDRGTAVILNIAKGTYYIGLSCAGYATRGLGYYQNRGRTLEAYDATLATAGVLNGKVQDPNGKPIASAAVTLGDMVAEDETSYELATGRAVTDAAGLFAVESLPAKVVGSLRVNKDGYAMAIMSQEVLAAKVAITLQFGATVRGRIKSVTAESAEQGIYAELTPEGGNRPGTYGGSTRCGDEGAFEFKNVPAGRYVLTGGVSPGGATGSERGPRKTLDVKPTKPGEVIEVDL